MSVHRPCLGEVSKCKFVDQVAPQRRFGGTLDDVEVDHRAHIRKRLSDRSHEDALDLDDLEVVHAPPLVVVRASPPCSVRYPELWLQRGKAIEAVQPGG